MHISTNGVAILCCIKTWTCDFSLINYMRRHNSGERPSLCHAQFSMDSRTPLLWQFSCLTEKNHTGCIETVDIQGHE